MDLRFENLVLWVAAICVPRTPAFSQVVVEDEIFGSKEAANLVEKARCFDPRFCFREQADREKAIGFYQEAMALQPGAKINAAIAARIAQLYAYYEDRDKGALAEPSKAIPWWRRCIEQTGPKQLLWAQAQAGLGSATFLTGDPVAAAGAFRAVLDIDPERMKLADWRLWPKGGDAAEKALLDREAASLRQKARRARIKAVDNIYYVLVRYDGALAASAMAELVRDYAGTPVADQATKWLNKSLTASGPTAYRYRGVPDVLSEVVGLGEGESSKGGGTVVSSVSAPGAEARKHGGAVDRQGGATGVVQETPAKTDRASTSFPSARAMALALVVGSVVGLLMIVLLVRRAAARRAS